MLAVIAFHEGDRKQAREQALWIRELGGVQNHECLLVPASNCDPAGVVEPLREAFGRVWLLPMWEEISGWPRAANITWSNIAQHISNPHPKKAPPPPQPWLWLEPDAAPLVATWLDQLQAEYEGCGKPILAAEVDHTAHGGRHYTSGVAVYPINTPFLCGEKILDLNDPQMVEAFDPYFREEFLPNAHLSRLIQHVWVTSRNPDVLPTFPDMASLGALWPEAVLFHRVKDGTLIKQLRQKKGGDALCALHSKNHSTGTAETPHTGENAVAPNASASNGAAPSDPVPAPNDRVAQLEKELAELRAQLCTPKNGPTEASSISQKEPPKRRRGRTMRAKPKRSSEEQAKIDARMAKVRAAKLAKA